MQRQDARIDGFYRTMIILWFAILFTVVLFFLLSVFVLKAEGTRNDILTIVFSALGTLFVIASFLVKQKYLQRAVDTQRIELVQTGHIIAWSMCEFSALLGLLDSLLTSNRYHFLLFVIGAIGVAAHFPRRDQLLAATYKTSSNGAVS